MCVASTSPNKKAQDMSSDKDIDKILTDYRTVAVVGLSADPSKYSHVVAESLQSKGWRVIPVNPNVEVVLGEKSYKSLIDLPESVQKEIEVVDVFRRSEDVPPIVDQAIQLREKNGKPYVVWMQLGIVNEGAAARARKAGLTVVMDKCMKMEFERLESSKDSELERIRAGKMRELAAKMKKDESPGKEPIVIDDEHFDETVKKHSLMLIDCWADWCGPCRMLAPTVDELARDYAGRVVVGKLNVDDNPQTAERFSVMSIPTLLVMKSGVEVDRVVGCVPKELIEEKLKKHL
jgi:thioredoxin